jgi:nucleoside-diphosphate-sugar epimerase
MAREISGMKLVITGHRGFVGSAVMRGILEDSRVERVMAVGRTPAAHSDSRVVPVAVDLASDIDPLISALRSFGQVDAIVNCAGTVQSEAAEAARGNVMTVANLLHAGARETPGAMFIQIGSAAEYGQPSAERVPVKEGTPPQPASVYGVSKLAATGLALACHSHGLNCTVLRVFNAIGANMPSGTLVGRLARILAASDHVRNEPVTCGPLDAFRDFVDIDDVALAVRAALTSAPALGQTINIGSGVATEVRIVVHELLRVAEFRGTILETTAGSDRSAAVSWQAADITRAREVLGWTPRTSLQQAIQKVIAHAAQAS